MTSEKEPGRAPLGTRREALRRHHPFTVPLLIVLIALSLLNVYALVLGIGLVADDVDHGAEFEDLSLRLSLLALAESVVSVGGLAGVWLRRMRGVYVYLVAKVLTFILGLAMAAEYVSLPVLLPLVLGGALWWAAHAAGWQVSGWDE